MRFFVNVTALAIVPLALAIPAPASEEVNVHVSIDDTHIRQAGCLNIGGRQSWYILTSKAAVDKSDSGVQPVTGRRTLRVLLRLLQIQFEAGRLAL